MKVLVLGGCGFIGSHITDALLEGGHHVHIFSRAPESTRASLCTVEYHIGDFSDQGAVDKALEGIDVVIHAISTTVPGTSNNDPANDIRGNLISTVQLLELMRKRDIRRMVYLSSGGTVYGNPERCPVPEDAPLHPISSYGVVKVAIENYLFMYQSLYGIQPTIIRPSNPYGPRQGQTGMQGVITSFLRDILGSKPLTIWGDGTVVRDFVDVRDVASLCAMAVSKPVSGVFNAGSGEGHSIKEIVDILALVTGINPECNFHEGRGFDVRKVVLDVRKSQAVFDWQPCIPLEQGIREYWAWMRSGLDKGHLK